MHASSNGPLMSERPSLLWGLVAIMSMPRVPIVATVIDVRRPIAVVEASSKCARATCPTVVLTPKRVITHEHDHMQKLLVAGAPTGQIGMWPPPPIS
jgi:hypothetical protein